ncbi:alpha-galactosidase [Paenibacillus doosanensis]|uniref:glycoside hydrolase family 36 protein n=1 Tax=Paenibacillus doosanensis TaxID=1229154 RepID=UPI00217F2FD1|nr:glycoside hydrolase family 36 protein [Paenibacillus doosanensis]MCS7460621.1 alpha-galactosidase [Paenibacillus doosanensis]
MTISEIQFIQAAASLVRETGGNRSERARVAAEWAGETASFRLINEGDEPISVKEIVLFQGAWPFGGDTKFYGEGYSMLSQYGGTIGEPKMIGKFDDRKHYKLPATEGFFTAYNFVLLSPEPTRHLLMGFTSCRRHTGEIRLAAGRFEVVLDGEELIVAPGESRELESFALLTGSDREALLEQFAALIEAHHPKLETPGVPTGWCSWYCFGPAVTEQNIFDNLHAIGKQVPQLKYIQIDDGYQAYMGDWLTPGQSFSDMEKLCKQIKAEGFEPAIWVAPFIAQQESALFREHPDWFIRDEEDKPLASNRISFGGWRHGPWYMLDGTHPEARDYLRRVFRTMREQWGCHYFKLDANMWGALPGGRRYIPEATKVEAYRMGMEAVLEGAGVDSFLLGCNAPMWPSLGTVHGMRVTGDISRKWPVFALLAAEGFSRNWQHGRLWVNDPDCLVLENRNIKLVDPDGTVRRGMSSITPDEFMFHAAYIVASGGMVLSGDDMQTMSKSNLQLVKKALTTRNIAARFDDDSFRVGRVNEPDRQLLCLFNWEEAVSDLTIQLDRAGRLEDFWTGEELGFWEGRLTLTGMPPHSARVLALYPCS